MRGRFGFSLCAAMILACLAWMSAGCAPSLPPTDDVDGIADQSGATSGKPIRLAANLVVHMDNGRVINLFTAACNSGAPYMELKYPFDVKTMGIYLLLTTSNQVWAHPDPGSWLCDAEDSWLRRVVFDGVEIAELYETVHGNLILSSTGEVSTWVSTLFPIGNEPTSLKATKTGVIPAFFGAKQIIGEGMAVLADGSLVTRDLEGAMSVVASGVQEASRFDDWESDYCWIESAGSVKCRFHEGFSSGPSPHMPNSEVVITSLPSMEWKAISVVGGDNPGGPSCVLAKNGEVWCWRHGILGYDDSKELLLSDPYPGTIAHSSLLAGWEPSVRPEPFLAHRIDGLPPASQIAVGYGASCALTKSDEIWCWGIWPWFDTHPPSSRYAPSALQQWAYNIGLDLTTGHLPRHIDLSKDVSISIPHVVDD